MNRMNKIDEMSAAELIGTSFRRYGNNFGAYLIAAAIASFFSAMIPAASSADIRPLMSVGLFCCFHGFYAAAASLAAGRWEQSFFSLAFDRSLGHALSLLAFLLIFFLINGAVLGFGMLLGARENTTFFYATGLSLFFVSALLVVRFWPLLTVLFLYEGRHRWAPSKSGAFWDGPSIGTSWRMTALDGVFARRTTPLLLVSTLILVPFIAALYFEAAGGLWYAVLLYFFLFAAPLVTQLTYDFSDTMKVKTYYDKQQ